ncbi:hypothetical protein FQN57_006013 [Myotisia sp. PD_48]|nr:hypothetical protein FQN57_006013 [Myotisia sp. PD_48]
MLQDRLRLLFGRRWSEQAYKPVGEDDSGLNEQDAEASLSDSSSAQSLKFSWVNYFIFLWMGVSMLWAWNCFLAAAPYFQLRFADNEWLRTNSQSAITSVFSVTALGAHFILVKLQKNASYTRRVMVSLVLIGCVFTLLAASTITAQEIPAGLLFAFVLLMVFGSSLASSMNQNGLFAYVSKFALPEYTQAIMAGQGVAGVLSCAVQLVSAVSVPQGSDKDVNDEVKMNKSSHSARSAFAFFSAATAVAGFAAVAFYYLTQRQIEEQQYAAPIFTNESARYLNRADTDVEDESRTPIRTVVPLKTLLRKLRWSAFAIFICFMVTMVFPIFASQIQSVNTEDPPPRYAQPDIFITLGLLFWNIGDLLGRLVVILPPVKQLIRLPFILFLLSLARILFIPLFFMCNVRGRGGRIHSDFVYLILVQGLFGATNGCVSASTMMGITFLVESDEREAAGAFMGLILVAGLAAGSLMSFFIGSA